MKNPWVVIPTYNERENIRELVPALFRLSLENLSVLIVDDSSPDGTGAVVQQLSGKYPNLKLETRPRKSGLGRAYIHGFSFALKHGADAVIQMDADFSHDPADVPKLLAALLENNADLVIGSRYVDGIRIINWPLRRLILSTAANLYARVVTGIPLTDITGGFRAWRSTALRAVDLESVDADGYGFQIVMTHRAWKNNKSVSEVPIIFTERRAGQSKMSRGIVWEAFWLVWKLKFFG